MKAQNFKYLSIIWLIAITVASLISAESVNEIKMVYIPGLDKLIHFVMYMILTILLLKSIKGRKYQIIGFSIFYGVLMEVLQFLISSGRSFEMYDIIANISGAIGGAIITTMFLNK